MGILEPLLLRVLFFWKSKVQRIMGILVRVLFFFASGKSEKNLERLNLGLACLMLAKPK